MADEVRISIRGHAKDEGLLKTTDVTIEDQDGYPLKGVSKLVLTLEPNELPKAELTILDLQEVDLTKIETRFITNEETLRKIANAYGYDLILQTTKLPLPELENNQ